MRCWKLQWTQLICFLKAVNTPQTKSKGNNDDTITAQHVKTKTESTAKIARIICSKVIL